MPEDLKPVLARQMEVYAGFLEHTDHHVGRLIDATLRTRDPREHARLLRHRRQRCVRRRNAERLFQRARRPQRRRRSRDPRVHGLAHRRLRHTQAAYNHYAVGWAHAMDTPYQWTKQVASHWGGTRNGTIVHWPDGHQGQGRDPLAVPPRDRRRTDRARGGRSPSAVDACNGVQQHAARRRLDGLLVRRREGRRASRRPSTSRCSATAASTTRAGPRSRATAPRG